MPFANIKENQFYYELHGEGDPLVLISGLKGDHANWLSVLDSFSKKYQVLIFDNRGVGRTKDQANNLTVEMMADDVMMLMDKLNIKNPAIVGHSLGGAIAQTLATKHPEKIKSLILCNTFSKFNLIAREIFTATLILHQQDAKPSTIMKQIIPYVFSDKFITDEILKFIEETSDANPYPQTLNGYQRQLDALYAFDSRKWIKNITTPTLLISSTQDQLATVAENIEMTNLIPNAKHIVLKTGHASLVENPLKFIEIISDFLTSVDADLYINT
jgi:3-oxoadipate enol-lactonase